MPVIKALTQDGEYIVKAVAWNGDSDDAKLVASYPNTKLFVGNTFDDADLRRAFKDVQLAFVNTNEYATGEKRETFGVRFDLAGTGMRGGVDL